MTDQQVTENQLPRILIIGGGAGGLELACQLGRKLGKKKKAEIILIDRNMTHLWKPLLHEVAAGSLNSYEDEISYLAVAHRNHFTFRLGSLESLNRKKQAVTISPSVDENQEEYIPQRTFHYDMIVFSVGSTTNDFGVPGVAEHCQYLDNRKQADRFHQELLKRYYRAHTQDEEIREGQLAISIAGAGATGVELSAELVASAEELVKYGLAPKQSDHKVEVILLEASDRILPALPERLSEMTRKSLEDIGINVQTGKRIVEATETGFKIEDGSFVPSEMKVWAAGIKAPDLLNNLDGLETNRINQIIVEPTLLSKTDDKIYALGDCAACPMEDSEHNVPPRAQAAHQQASLIVKSITRRLEGRTDLPTYNYVDYGSLIHMSKYSTVGSLMGNLMGKSKGRVLLEGFFARMVYISLYKMHRVAVLGYIREGLTTFANILSQKTKPRMKMH